MKKLKVYKTFSGKQYVYVKGYRNKVDANKKARNMRKRGYRVRVIPYTGIEYSWSVYARSISTKEKMIKKDQYDAQHAGNTGKSLI